MFIGTLRVNSAFYGNVRNGRFGPAFRRPPCSAGRNGLDRPPDGCQETVPEKFFIKFLKKTLFFREKFPGPTYTLM